MIYSVFVSAENPERSAGKQLREEPQAEPGGFHLSAADQLKSVSCWQEYIK